MTNEPARDNLAARYKGMAAEGLVDVKYSLSNSGEATTDQVCREVEAMYAALERGDCEDLDFGDRTLS